MEKNKTLILSSYGLVTCFVLCINLIIIETLFSNFFSEKNWTIGKELIWLIWVIASIGLGNVIFTHIVFDISWFNFRILYQMLFGTFIIGTIPISILIITKQKFLLKKHLKSSKEFNAKLQDQSSGSNQAKIVRFYANNDKDFIEFDVDDFLFIESSGNYIDLYFLSDDKIVSKTFRSTLKRALDFFKETPWLIQCHRAYIVNTKNIISTKGNSQGLQLSLKNCENMIPVSKKFVKQVQGIIHN